MLRYPKHLVTSTQFNPLRKIFRFQNGSQFSLNYYKRRVKELQQRVKSNKISDAAILSYLSTKFNKQLLEFFSMQLKSCGRSKHGRRYTPEQKSLCLAMYKQGPKSYRFNEKWCALPTKRTLGRYSANLIFKSGADSKTFDAIKNIVKDWPQKDKYCAISWDEVSLKKHLSYCQSLDKIEGFVEMIKTKVPIFATHAMTFMVRGFEVPFKQATGYFYTNGIKAFELVELIKLMIERILATGLNPILSICDQANTNATTVNELVNPNSLSTKQTGGVLRYKVNNHQLIHGFDPSHLIKVVRNNCETKNLAHRISERWQTGDTANIGSLQIACWDDIYELYRMDLRSTQRRLPKLTDEHLKPNKLKMKVSNATQVFSNTCGTVMLRYVEQGIIPKHFTSTAKLLLFMNDVFDSINGSDNQPAGTLKSAVTSNSIHFEFWDYALLMLQNMFYVDKFTGKMNNRSSVLKKFESTIRGYREVVKICFNAGIETVNIRDTTQDGLENFFGCIKSCNQNNKATPSQYRTGYTTMIVNNITGTNSLQSNCQPDQSTAMLTNIHEFITVCQETCQESDSIDANNASEMNLDEVTFFDSPKNLSDCDHLESMIVFDPQSEREEAINFDTELCGTEVDLIKFEAISHDSSRICQKLFKTTKCEECKNNFELMDETAALLSIENVLRSLNEIIPKICFEDSLKKKLTKHIESMRIHFIGCSDHNQEIDQKIKNLAADHVILTFCNDISKILSGKIQVLPDNPNFIQKLAYEEGKKKNRIGKYSDVFNEQ